MRERLHGGRYTAPLPCDVRGPEGKGIVHGMTAPTPQSSADCSSQCGCHHPDMAGQIHALLHDVLRHEADALGNLATRLAQDPAEAAHWARAVELIARCTGHVVVSGMGKSGLVGAKISATFSSLGIPSHFMHPADAMHGDLGAIRRADVVMLLSFSGSTAELIDLATVLGVDGVQRLGISRSHDSPLGKICEAHLALGDLDEAGPLSLAPTTSTTATMACGDALALAVAHQRDFSASDFRQRHPGGSLGAMLRPVADLMRFRVGENLTTVAPETTVSEALAQCAAGQDGPIRHAGALLVVSSDGRLTGLFTDGDLRRLVLEDSNGLGQPIADVMTADPLTLGCDATVGEARQTVAAHRVDELPVVDADHRPVGLIDIQDLLAPRVAVD